MSWPRGRLFAAILALSAPWAVADTIAVNTTADDFANNDQCSLREAVEFFNRDKPAGGFQGCVPDNADSYAVINLPASAEPYLIGNSSAPTGHRNAIHIKRAITINGEGRRTDADATTTLQVQGPHRAFVVSYNPVYLAPRCSLPTQGPCASATASFDIDPISDTGTPGDYLTTVRAPLFNGTLPGVAAPVPAHSYLIRVYDYPKEGPRVELGRTKVPLSSTDVNWQVKATRVVVDGVHLFRYTVEVVDSLSGATVTAESDPAAAPYNHTVRLAVYSQLDRYNIRLSQMVIKGCGIATGCADGVDDNTTITNDPALGNADYDLYGLSFTNGLDNTGGNGGIVFNDESLLLADVLMRDGVASRGGAIYVADNSAFKAEETEFRGNTADRGAALYSEANAILMETSLATANTVSDAGGAVIEVASAALPTGLAASRIVNTTISGNAGRALSLRQDAIVSASTIISNAGGGILANSEDVDVYNSIVAGNLAGSDCELFGATSVSSYNLFQLGGGCSGVNLQVISGMNGTAGQLLATEVDGRCTGQYGLLCPLADHGGASAVHLPRVLQDYDVDPALLGASPIVNKGAPKVGGSDPEACPGQDQRTQIRVSFSCDIGAVELQSVAPGASTASGGSIVHGQSFTAYLGNDLADEVLLPAVKCPLGVTPFAPADMSVYPPVSLAPDASRVVPGSYRDDVPGCPWLVQRPERGDVTFTLAGDYNYRPASAFHGFDRFELRVVTTLSNLNAQPDDRSRLIRAQVIVEPSTTMTSSKLSGAMDSLMLLVLAALGLAWRHGGKA